MLVLSRILEQCIYTNYKPYLNIKNEQPKDIIFFNFSNPSDPSDPSEKLIKCH